MKRAIAVLAVLGLAGSLAGSASARTASRPAETVRLVIRTEPGLRPAFGRLDRRFSVQKTREIPQLHARAVDLAAGTAPAAIVAYRALPGVRTVDRAVTYRALSHAPNDPAYPDQYSLQRIDAPEAWHETAGNASGLIAVVDTGVSALHEDLRNQTVPGRSFVTEDPNDTSDPHGHGTGVAGIIAAERDNGRGMAGVTSDKVVPVRALDENGAGDDFTIADAIRWSADRGAKIINLSLGGPGYSAVLDDAARYATSKGSLLVAGSGNWGVSVPFYPAALPNVLAVGATDADDEIPLWSQDGDGPNYGSWLDLVAPGTALIAPANTVGGSIDDYVLFTGTSAAAPVVAGVAALIREQFPTLTPAAVADRLRSTADDLGLPGRDRFYGAGRVNAHRAVGGSPAAAPAQTEPQGEPPDTLDAAVALSGTAQATIYPAGDRDWWRIDVPEGGHLSVTVDPPADVDPEVSVYDQELQLLELIDFTFSGETEEAHLNITGGGTHWIGVRNWLPNGVPGEPYSITLTAGPGPGGTGFESVQAIERTFFTWYDRRERGRPNWLMTALVEPGSGGYVATVAGDDVWGDVLGPQPTSDPQQFGGLIGGPVEVKTVAADPMIVSQRLLWAPDNFEEVPGVRSGELTEHAWFSWYDGIGTGGRDWVLAANPGPWRTTAQIRFAGVVVAERSLRPGENLIWSDAARRGGPVEVTSTPGWPLLASRRTLWATTNFSEIVGTRDEDLTSDYAFPWYDAKVTQGRNWILIANPASNGGPIDVRVRIPNRAGSSIDQVFTVAAGATITPTFPGVVGGPVRVTGVGEDPKPFVATQRNLFDNRRSFEEVAGVPAAGLPQTVHYSWYDAVRTNNRDWVLVANPSDAATVDVTIRIGSQQVFTGSIEPGGIVTPRFQGVVGGPVTVTATGPIVSSRRTLWGNDFTELIGQQTD